MSELACDPNVAIAIDVAAGELPGLPSGLQQWLWL